MKRFAMRETALAGVLTLAACSDEPSAADMVAAVGKNPQFRQGLMMVAMGDSRWRSPDEGVNALLKTASVEKSACIAAQGAPGSVCDFRLGFKQADGRLQYGAPVKGRFFKTGDGWAIEVAR
jgi:hypothetical protein